MANKSLNDKIKIIGFWTFGGVFWYLVISFFLLSEYPIQNYSFDLKKAYEVLKDSLTLVAAFLAPVAAFVLFSDWREQHNKQVRNEFGLKVFNQFEKFSKEIDQLGFIYTELEYLLPDEAKDKMDPYRIPLGLDHPIFKNNEHLIKNFFKQLQLIQEEFNTLMDKFRYFGVVTNQLKPMVPWITCLLKEFADIHDELNDSYSDYLQLLEIYEEKITLYSRFRSEIEEKLTLNILQQLQED